ncbi:MAG: FtsX-like permease family protein [Alcanivorax sp.]|nr:FtsX-like permease family protein [Alcanivorax sp.]
MVTGAASAAEKHRAFRLPTFLFMAWRNLWRYPVRSLLTMSALAGGLAMVILYDSLMVGMARQMVVYATEISTGDLQIHRQAYADDQDLYATLPWAWLTRIEEDLPGLNVAPRLYAAGLASVADASNGVMIRAVDPQRERTVTRMLGQVRRGQVDLGVVDHTARGLTRYGVVVGAQLAKNMQVGPGDELVLVTQAADGSIGNGLYVVTAVLKPVAPDFDRMGVLMSISAYRQLMVLNSGFHELAVGLDGSRRLEDVQAALQQELATLNQAMPLDKLGGPPQVRSWKQLNPAVADMLSLSHAMTLIIGLIIVGLASLGMLNTMLMAVHERTQEFGILLAIGMKKRWVLLMVLLEALCLSLLAALAGALLGSLLGLRMERVGIDFSQALPEGYDWGGIVFEPVMKGYLLPSHVLYACLGMIVIALLASVVPSWRSIRMKPAEVMR